MPVEPCCQEAGYVHTIELNQVVLPKLETQVLVASPLHAVI
jgi:hypothetical protein